MLSIHSYLRRYQRVAMDKGMVPADVELLGQHNNTFEELDEFEKRVHNWLQAFEVLILIMTIVGIFISSLMMYSILKYPKLNTRVNHYIFHMLLCLMIYYIVQNLTVSLYCIILDTRYIIIEIMRVVWNLEEAALALMFTFATALALDWYAVAYDRTSWIRFQQKSYKCIICLLYLIAIFKICLYFAMPLSYIEAVLIFFFPAFILITICNFIKCCTSISADIDSSNSLRVANTALYLYCPLIIYISIFNFSSVEQMKIMEKPLVLTLFIPQVITCCIPLIIFFILKKNDKDFETAFLSFWCRKRSSGDDQLQLQENEKM